ASGEFLKQQQALHDLLDRTKELVEASEISEPLLSKRLYDALRDLRKYQPEESLQAAARMILRGLPEQAAELEQQAREGIQQLQAGIENAADSILGNEKEA